jgi:hypothetical protein
VSDRAQFIVLSEDQQAQVFIRRALIKTGAKRRRIRCIEPASVTDGGAGDAYVIKKYPLEVKAFRSQSASASTGLVVHIDADPRKSVEERHRQLAAALTDTQLSTRGQDEPIAELVPKRNIETWIYALDNSLPSHPGKSLTEVDEFPRLRYESDCSVAAEAFGEHARKGTVPPSAKVVPSLLDGLKEFRRLP